MPDPRNDGHICYIEIPAPDVAKAKRFYAAVFGWRTEDSDLGDAAYTMFRAGAMIGGLDSSKQPTDKGVLLYLKVEDIPSALRAIREAGGEVITNKSQVTDGSDAYGFAATFTDPNGNLLGLWAKS